MPLKSNCAVAKSAWKMGALSAEALKREMRQCIAWGVPDNECAGMTARNLIAVISKALARIEQLEKENDAG